MSICMRAQKCFFSILILADRMKWVPKISCKQKVALVLYRCGGIYIGKTVCLL